MICRKAEAAAMLLRLTNVWSIMWNAVKKKNISKNVSARSTYYSLAMEAT